MRNRLISRNLAGDAVDLHPIPDPDAVLTHEDKPAKERDDEILQDQRQPGRGEAEDRRHLAGGAEDDKQHDQCANELYAEFEDDVQRLDAAPVKLGTLDVMTGKSVEEDHADQNEKDERERLQQQMRCDSLLQQDLRGPLAVNTRELLLALGAIVTDAEHLAERIQPSQAGEGSRTYPGQARDTEAALIWFASSERWAASVTMSACACRRACWTSA